jgi:hypothetical protein
MNFYITNTAESISFTDLAGNMGTGQITINRITPPSSGGDS